MRRRFIGRAGLPQRERKLVVDAPQPRVLADAILRHVEGLPQRRHRFRASIQPELTASEVVERVGGRALGTHAALKRRKRLLVPLRFDERHAETQARDRIARRELQLFLKLRDRFVHTGDAFGHDRERAQV